MAQALSAERVRAVHAGLLAVLVAELDADPEHLAVHAQGAGDREMAARYAAQAAAAASKAMAFERAALLYRRALELDTQDEHAQRELRTKLGGAALANAGRGADAARTYLDAAQGADEDTSLRLKRECCRAAHVRRAHRQRNGSTPRGAALRGAHAAAQPQSRFLCALWHRARLRMRGLSFRERKGDLPIALRRRIEALVRNANYLHDSIH